MTLEEADEYSFRSAPYTESEEPPVYVEYATGFFKPWARLWLTTDMLRSWLSYLDTRIAYGKEWRCWTRKPTDRQKMAAKWND